MTLYSTAVSIDDKHLTYTEAKDDHSSTSQAHSIIYNGTSVKNNLSSKFRVLRQNDDEFADTAFVKTTSFQLLKNWEGVVTEIGDTSFFAQIRRLNSNSPHADDGVEIDLSNVDDGDQELVVEGAIFYLTVGVLKRLGERNEKTTRVIFRRMPRWSKSDLINAEAQTENLWQKLQRGLDANTASDPE